MDEIKTELSLRKRKAERLGSGEKLRKKSFKISDIDLVNEFEIQTMRNTNENWCRKHTIKLVILIEAWIKRTEMSA